MMMLSHHAANLRDAARRVPVPPARARTRRQEKFNKPQARRNNSASELTSPMNPRAYARIKKRTTSTVCRSSLLPSDGGSPPPPGPAATRRRFPGGAPPSSPAARNSRRLGAIDRSRAGAAAAASLAFPPSPSHRLFFARGEAAMMEETSATMEVSRNRERTLHKRREYDWVCTCRCRKSRHRC